MHSTMQIADSQHCHRLAFRFHGPVAGCLLAFLTCSVASLGALGEVFPTMHVWRSDNPPFGALAGAAAMTLFIPIFAAARFSFGYLVAFQVLSAVFGFIWLSFFSAFDYPHAVARWSMALSLAAAIAPLLFLRIDIPRLSPSTKTWTRVIQCLVMVSVAVLAADAIFGLAFGDPYGGARNIVTRPALLNYLTGITIGAVLPYLFAHFAQLQQWRSAAGILLLSLLFYPVVVNKTVLLIPAWLPFMFLLFRWATPRVATVLALLIPLIVGLADYASLALFPSHSFFVLGAVNLRSIAVPSLALDHYADFFNHNTPTYFCQISVIKRLAGCAYQELGLTLAEAYQIGNFNASFLATEGIASVGLAFAPISAFACGLVLAFGNSTSRHLSPQFIAVSSSVAVYSIINVPLTTALLSNGVGLLFLLWALTPAQPQITATASHSAG